MTEQVAAAASGKPGWKTTELWGAGTITVIVQDTMTKTDDWRVQAAGCIALAIIGAAYIACRSKVKAA